MKSGKWIRIGLGLTAATLAVWLATGRHYYTKFSVVERSAQAIAADDPLAGTGFYDDEEQGSLQVERRDEFHLGLLPTAGNLWDKHVVSVLSIVALTWALCLPLQWRHRRRTT